MACRSARAAGGNVSRAGEIWRCVTRAAGSPLPVGLAYRLSVVKLLVDQALPSSGLSGAVVVAGALQRRGIGEDVTTAGIVVNASAYLMAYIAALGAGLAVLSAEGRASAPVLVAGGIFVLVAAGVATAAIRLSGTQAQWLKGRAHVPAWLRRALEMLARARPRLVRNPPLLASATALQLAIVALDALTLWALIRSLGVAAPLGAVFTSFMISTVLRTVSIVPAGLGAFEAASIFTLHGADFYVHQYGIPSGYVAFEQVAVDQTIHVELLKGTRHGKEAKPRFEHRKGRQCRQPEPNQRARRFRGALLGQSVRRERRTDQVGCQEGRSGAGRCAPRAQTRRPIGISLSECIRLRMWCPAELSSHAAYMYSRVSGSESPAVFSALLQRI
ncbi:MAG: lysylphosphatidylglycerol synthase transmembrane domain-containing protein [Burkholderiales bacterium]